jgi:ketosteroid isomerase-like protein
MSQENVEVVRLAYAAVSEGNLDTLVEVTAPDAVLDFSRSIGPQKGTYRGREAFGRYIAGIAEAFERFQLSPVDFVVGAGGEIVVRHHVSAKGRASGLEIDRVPDVALVWELRDGRVIKTTMYQPHAEASKPSGCGSRRSRRRTWILRDGTGSLRAKAPTTKSFALSRRMWSGTTRRPRNSAGERLPRPGRSAQVVGGGPRVVRGGRFRGGGGPRRLRHGSPDTRASSRRGQGQRCGGQHFLWCHH